MKNVRMSAQKMREVVRQIQGLPALEAQAVLQVVPRGDRMEHHLAVRGNENRTGKGLHGID